MGKRVSILCFCLLIGILVTPFAAAQSRSLDLPTPTVIDYPLPYPGLLPNHPLYFLKNLRDVILLFFTRDSIKNSRARLLIADKHIAMGIQFGDSNSYEQAAKSLEKGEKHLLIAILQLGNLKKRDALPTGIIDKFELAAKKHENIITDLINKAPSEQEKKNLRTVLGTTHQAIEKIQLAK